MVLHTIQVILQHPKEGLIMLNNYVVETVRLNSSRISCRQSNNASKVMRMLATAVHNEWTCPEIILV